MSNETPFALDRQGHVLWAVGIIAALAVISGFGLSLNFVTWWLGLFLGCGTAAFILRKLTRACDDTPLIAIPLGLLCFVSGLVALGSLAWGAFGALAVVWPFGSGYSHSYSEPAEYNHY